MLCSSSTLARPDWLCNGNWRFITPAGVANHRRREAWGEGRMSRGGLHECPAVTTSDWLHLLAWPTHRYTDWHASSHTCRHAHSDMTHMQTHVCLLQHNGRLGRMCGRDRIFPPPFLAVRRFLSCPCERLKTDAQKQRGLKQRNGFAGGLK